MESAVFYVLGSLCRSLSFHLHKVTAGDKSVSFLVKNSKSFPDLYYNKISSQICFFYIFVYICIYLYQFVYLCPEIEYFCFYISGTVSYLLLDIRIFEFPERKTFNHILLFLKLSPFLGTRFSRSAISIRISHINLTWSSARQTH